MEQTKLTPSGKPFDIHERLLLILDAGTSVGSNAEEADGASSHDDWVKILGKIVHNALRNSAADGRRRR